MDVVSPLHRTLEQQLLALARGVSMECLVCGEFVLRRGADVCCPECGAAVRAGEGVAPAQLHFDLQAG